MHILLVDVDSKIPNIALMKLSTFHKEDNVELLQLNYSGYPRKNNLRIDVDAYAYDVVYASAVFDINKDIHINGCDVYDIGGTGISLTKCLPQEIDDLPEDYSIYPNNNSSYGFITRGCSRNCSFCFVPKKRGRYIYIEIGKT